MTEQLSGNSRQLDRGISPEVTGFGIIRRALLADINERKEELVKAWVAKYGFDPKDAIIEQRVGGDFETLNVRVWVERDGGIMCGKHGNTIKMLNQRVGDLENCALGNHGPATDIVKIDGTTAPGCMYCGKTI